MTTIVSELTARFGADTTGLARGIQDVNQQLSNAQRTVGQRMTAIGGSITKAGVAFGALGGVATVVFGSAVKSAMDWESAFAGVIKTVDGTSTELDALETQLRAMSTSSTNPLAGLDNSALTLARIAELGGQLGVNIEDIAGFTQVIGELTIATNLTADSASTMIAQFANIVGMDLGTDLRGLGNVLVDLGNNSATTESQIMEMATRLAGIGAVWGIGYDQILGLAAAMASLGISPEAGGTAMTQFMNDMGTAAATHNDDLARFAEIAGMTADAFAETWDLDPMDAIVAFLEGFAELDPGAQSEALADLGLEGIRTADMIRRLSNNTDLLVISLGRADDAIYGSALGDEAATRFETFEAKMNALQGQMFNLKVVIGDALIPSLLNLADGVTPVITAFANWADVNPGLITSIAGVGGVLALVGLIAIPVGMAISALGSIFGVVTGILKFGGGALGAGVGLITAIGALTLGVIGVGIAAGVALHKWDWFREHISEPIVLGAVTALRDAIVAVKDAIGETIALWEQLRTAIEGPSGSQGTGGRLDQAYVESFARSGTPIDTWPLEVQEYIGFSNIPTSGGLGSQVQKALGGQGFGTGSLISGLGGWVSNVINQPATMVPEYALGGRISGPSIVGEREPELFIPDSVGTIIPFHQLGLGGGGMTVIMYDPVFQGVEDAERLYDTLALVQARRS